MLHPTLLFLTLLKEKDSQEPRAGIAGLLLRVDRPHILPISSEAQNIDLELSEDTDMSYDTSTFNEGSHMPPLADFFTAGL